MGSRTSIAFLMLGCVAAIGFLMYTNHQAPVARTAAPEAATPKATQAHLNPPAAHPPDGPPSISGIVTYEDTGKPVSGVTVELRGGGPSTRTDAQGHYSIADIKPDSYLLAVADPPKGWTTPSPPLLELHRGSYTQNLTLCRENNETSASPPNGTITGKITEARTDWTDAKFARLERAIRDSLGKEDSHPPEIYEALEALCESAQRPLPGVRVTLTGGEEQQDSVTGTDGAYSFGNLPAGEYTLTVEKPEGAFVESEASLIKKVQVGDGVKEAGVDFPVPVDPTASTQVRGVLSSRVETDFSLRFDSITATGRVVDGAGAPLEGVEIVATCFDNGNEGDPSADAPTSKAISRKDGAYRLEGLLATQNLFETMKNLGIPYPRNDIGNIVSGITYTVRASREGYLSAELTLPIVTEERLQMSRRLFRIITAGTIAETAPYPPDETPLPKFQGNTMTDVNLVLVPESILAGTLVDAQRNPIPNGTLSLHRKEPPSRDDLQTSYAVPGAVGTDGEGGFKFLAVPPGSYTFSAGPANGTGVVLSKNPPLTVKAGDSVTGLVVVADVAARGAIEGTVLDAALGTPRKEFAVEVVSVQETKELNPSNGQLTTEPARPGFFRIDNLTAGLVTLKVTSNGCAPETLRTRVLPGQCPKVIAKLGPEALLRVWVTRHGTPVADANVSCTDEQGNPGTQQPPAKDNPQPYYEFKSLRAGECAIGIEHAGMYRREKVKTAAGTLTEATIELYGDSGIYGTVTGQKGLGVCIAIYEMTTDSNGLQTPPTDDTLRTAACTAIPPGTYTIDELPTGQYIAVARSRKGLGAPPPIEKSQTLTLQAEQHVELNFDMTP